MVYRFSNLHFFQFSFWLLLPHYIVKPTLYWKGRHLLWGSWLACLTNILSKADHNYLGHVLLLIGFEQFATWLLICYDFFFLLFVFKSLFTHTLPPCLYSITQNLEEKKERKDTKGKLAILFFLTLKLEWERRKERHKKEIGNF